MYIARLVHIDDADLADGPQRQPVALGRVHTDAVDLKVSRVEIYDSIALPTLPLWTIFDEKIFVSKTVQSAVARTHCYAS